jgi:hypothetical protein
VHERQEEDHVTPQELRRERQRYAEDVLARYCRTPGTLGKVRPEDRRLARLLWDRNVPLAMVEDAFTLAAARRTFRPPDAPPLDPIRSLHYFVPLVEELLQGRVDPHYLQHVRQRLHDRDASPTSHPRRR